MNKNHLFLGMASFFLLHLPLAIAVTSSGTVVSVQPEPSGQNLTN